MKFIPSQDNVIADSLSHIWEINDLATSEIEKGAANTTDGQYWYQYRPNHDFLLEFWESVSLSVPVPISPNSWVIPPNTAADVTCQQEERALERGELTQAVHQCRWHRHSESTKQFQKTQFSI
jgi:hypothetical protein